MPRRGNLFENVEDLPVSERIRREAKEVQHFGGGNFPSTGDILNSEQSDSDMSILSMTPAGEKSESRERNGVTTEHRKEKTGDPDMEMDDVDLSEVEIITDKTSNMTLTEDEQKQTSDDWW